MAVGKRYRAKHITPGLINYPDGNGILYVSQEAIDKMRPSFIGKPVINFEHSDLSPEELLDFSPQDLEERRLADGIISAVGKDDDGWDFVDFVLWNEEAQKSIDERGYSVSNAYLPTGKTGPGSLNGVEYDEQLTDGEYLHLAIVPNPRYEQAKVYANSKPNQTQEEGMGFKLFRKKPDPAPAQVKNQAPEVKEEEMEVSNAYVTNEAGEKIPMEELINAYKAKMAEAAAPEEEMLNMDDMVEVDGEKVPVKALMDAYMSANAATNAEPPTDTQAEDVVDESQQTAYANAAPKTVNKALQNAARNPEPPKTSYRSRDERLAEGKARYGSKVKQEAK